MTWPIVGQSPQICLLKACGRARPTRDTAAAAAETTAGHRRGLGLLQVCACFSGKVWRAATAQASSTEKTAATTPAMERPGRQPPRHADCVNDVDQTAHPSPQICLSSHCWRKKKSARAAPLAPEKERERREEREGRGDCTPPRHRREVGSVLARMRRASIS